jgi:hypothetical protein
VAQRLAASQARILALLGGSLTAQLLAEEAADGRGTADVEFDAG